MVAFMAWPNVQHAKNYNSHVVYPTKTIEVLEALDEVSAPEDFVVTWWDYGSGCWFYGDTRTFTSPAHQTFDNYLTSEILRSQSAIRAKNLARLKTETYVRLQEERGVWRQDLFHCGPSYFQRWKPGFGSLSGFA